MIRKFLKIILIIVFLFIICVKSIKADSKEYSFRKQRWTSTYAVYDGEDKKHIYFAQAYLLDDKFAYCLEPGVNISTTYYYATDDFKITGIDKEKIDKVKLISYYGYGFGNHTHRDYYLASQEMIWKEITNRDTYWVSREDVDGPRINVDSQKKEITNLINAHGILPSFANKTYDITEDEEFTLNDDNNVLNNFEITSSSIKDVKIKDNKLIIKSTNNDLSGQIKLTKKSYTNDVTLFYYNGSNQKMISATTKIEPVIASINVNIKYLPRVKVIKVDSETGKKIKIPNIKFKIKNLDKDEYVCDDESCIYKTNKDGEFKTKSQLKYGNYQLEEIDEPINNYLWNKEPKKFTIDETNDILEGEDGKYIIIKFNNTRVKGSFTLKKIGEKPQFTNNSVIYNKISLNNVVFNLYAGENIYDSDGLVIYKKDEFINTYKTIDGKINVDNLYLGNYCLKEVSTESNHQLIKEPYCFDIDYVDQYTEKVNVKFSINNYLKKGVLEFTKTESILGTPLSNTLIEVYTFDDKLIYSDYTNDLGKIVLEGLPLGKYYIIEKKAPLGYDINNDKIFFEIKDNNELVRANMVDDVLNVPSTNQNESYLNYIVSCILILLGLSILIYDKK